MNVSLRQAGSQDTHMGYAGCEDKKDGLIPPRVSEQDKKRKKNSE